MLAMAMPTNPYTSKVKPPQTPPFLLELLLPPLPAPVTALALPPPLYLILMGGEGLVDVLGCEFCSRNPFLLPLRPDRRMKEYTKQKKLSEQEAVADTGPPRHMELSDKTGLALVLFNLTTVNG